MRRKAIFNFIIIMSAFSILLSSCSEGIFNFSEETGNISIDFFADSSVTSDLAKIVINLSNSDTGDTLKKDCSIEYSDGGQSSDCYISRIDTGHWQMKTIVYDENGGIIAEGNDEFELELGQTLIADFNLYNDGNLNLDWETPTGGEPVSLLQMKSFDTMINLFHYEGTPISEAHKAVYMIAGGTNFDTALSRLRVEFPDDGYFEYEGGFSRSIGNVEIEASSTMLSVSRAGYTARGNYNLIVSDVNGVETTLSDDCSFDFEPDYGAASFVTAPAYAGGIILTETTDYDINGSSAAGCYLVYCVDETDGTNLGGVPKINPSGAASLDMTAALGVTTIGFVVIVTLDAVLSQTDIDAHFMLGTTDLSPEKLPGWLYMNFGEEVNFVGASILGPFTF